MVDVTLDKLNTANISGNASDASATVIGNFIAARLKQKGIDPNKLHFDVFEDGYLWQQSFDYDAEISQVRTMVCVEKEQVKNLLKIVSEVVQPNAFAGGSRSVIDRLSNQTIGQLTGDSFDRGASPNHISDYLAKRSLPFQTKLMQAIERGEDLKDIETDLKHLKRIKLKLEDVLNHRYQEYEYVKQVRDSGETEWQFVPIDGSQREVVREVSFDGSELNTVIWLDLNEEMP